MRQFLHFLGAAIFLLGTLSLYSQGVTTATLRGQITDVEGLPLSGATIRAIHTPSGTKYGVNTRDDGNYTLANLRVGGPYKIEVSFIGYQKQQLTGIYLNLGQKLQQNFTLASEDVSMDDVDIVATPDPIMNGDRTGAETNIDNTQLRRLPTISRSASDYTRLNPASSGNSFAGRNDQFNNFSLDGSIFNNPFGLDAATPGGQTDAQPISLDAIDQIQVAIAPYDVTQAGFTGASVNAVTKSGTNEFKGTVFGFFRNQDLTGTKVASTDIVVPDLSQLQTGFSLGGPLIKNRLFFFANLEIERRSDLGSNFIANNPDRNGENVSRVEEADLIAVQTALAGLGYNTGAYEGYIHRTDNEKGIFKLDFAINEKNTLTATYNFLRAAKQKPAHPSALGRRGPDATTLQFFNSGYEINNNIQSGILEWRSLINNRFSNKLQVGYSSFRDFRNALSDPFPVVNILRDGIRYIVAGHEPFSINNVLDQDVFQITNNFNAYLGDHTITVGASLERFDFNNSFNLGVYDSPGNPGGTFGPGFASVQAFLDTVNSGAFDDDAAFAQETFDNNNANDSWALAETNVGQAAFYLQDEWSPNNNLKLTFGLRFDLPLYFDTPEKIQENIDRNCCVIEDLRYFDENGDSIRFAHTQLPDQVPLISPRFGFNWDVNGQGKTQVRGGTGLFTGRFPFVWVGNQVANPNFFFYNVTRPDFRFPQVWRTNLGIDQAFGEGWIATMDAIYTQDINGMMVRNYGLTAPSGTLQGVDNRVIYQPTDRANDFANNAYVFTNTDIGYTFNLTLQLQRTWGKDFYTSIGYNFLDAQDASSIEAEISSDAYDRNPAIGDVNQAVLAPSLYGNRHRFVGSGFKKFTYGNMATTIGLFFEYAQGGRFSYTYSGDLNRDGSPLNDLIYIPTADDLNNMQFAGDVEAQESQREALQNFILQDGYLSERRGGYVEKYGILSPWFSTWDLRILQDFNFQVGAQTHTIQASFDFLNLGNLISSNWGVRQFPVNTQPIGVTVDENNVPTYSFDEALTSTFTNDFGLNSRWQLQLGLRYIF
ncbi:MAG: carboxypeptidase regulatory-like domain-containing protein [Bacteroidota bacterium]